MSEYSADAPLSASINDKFQRWPFARRVARVIASRSDAESLVIGINGAWGEGKTTVLNFIEEELITYQNVIVFRFNPWRFPDETKLIRDFFHSLAGAVDRKLDKKHEKIGSFIGKYIAGPASLAGAGEAAKAVGEMLSSVELDELKIRVEAALKEAGKRVVVLMDDIDRLDKNEIQTVFRLVKLVADFQNTAYVLAFDAEMVASALQERYSSRDLEAGQNFLEKIIQVPLDLPQIPQSSLREFCFGIVETVLRDAEVDLIENDVRNFVRAFDSGLLPRLTTPRMARRYGNILSFALPILKGEVNLVDLMLVEGLRIFYSCLYDCVRDNRNVFLPSGNDWQSGNAHDQTIRKVVELALSGFSPEDAKAATELLCQLFPMIQGAFGRIHYTNSFAERWASERRVASPAYFQRYFSYAIPEGQISDQELAEFVSSLKTNSDEANATELKRLCRAKNATDVISKLRMLGDTLDVESAVQLARAVVADGSIYPDPKQLWTFSGPFSQAAMLVSGLVGRVTLLTGQEEGLCLADSLVERAEPLRFASEVVSWIRYEEADGETSCNLRSHDRPGRKAFPKEDRRRIIAVLVDRIKLILADAAAAATIPMNDLIRYLSIWKAFDPGSGTAEYVNRLFETDARMPLNLLDALRPTSWSMTTGLPSKSEFERRDYDQLASFADPETFRHALEERFGPYQYTERFPREYEETDPERSLAEQFLWLHAAVQREKAATSTVESPGEAGQLSSV